MFASKSERKVRYSIRKFSIGVASVVVASLFLGGVVHAEGVGGTSQGIPLKATDKDELYEKAVKEVNIEISKHMSNRLDQLDRQSSGFTEILKKIQGVVEDYRKQIDEALSKDGVEKLGEEAKKKIDELVEAFQNNSDNQIPPKKPQNDGVQGDDSSAGQGKQPDASNSGDSKPVPPETSGETKPKDSNDSMTTLEKELKEAKETAKTTLDNYRLTRLKKENGGAFWFGELLKESEESIKKYKRMFDEASSKEKVENLVKEAEQEIEALVVKHKGREIGLERNKAKAAVTKHLTGLLDDIKKNLEKEQHINTVELIKELKDIEKTYLHKLDESTQTDQLQELVTESQSKLDEALSNFKKGLSSSSNSGSSTKPETPEKPERPAPSKPAEKEQNPSGSTTGSHSGSTSSSGSSSTSTKPKSPEKPEQPQPSKPAEKEQNPSGSTAGSHSGSTSSSGSSSASTKPKSPEKPGEPTPSNPSGNETNSSSPTRSNSLSPTLSSQPTSPVQKVFTAQNGNAKITVMFETATEADSVNLKEVTTKEMVDNVTRQTGQGTVRIFDISLSKDGKETHVKGERVVRLAIGNIESEIQVYHVKENGELELLPSTVENGQVVFKTSHFSLFAIKTLPKKQMVAEPEANREGKTQSDDKEMVLLADKANQMSENHSNSDKKDKRALPSTGTMSTLFMEFLGLISLVGVYLLKGKKTEND
ncbi:RICH domain-containing protein [Streptococcus pneumoniae]|nr:RICH domain-containing protein [Streptococcus pneumoniae]